MSISQNCPVCQSTALTHHVLNRKSEPPFKDLNARTCNQCQLSYLVDRIPDDQLSAYYRDYHSNKLFARYPSAEIYYSRESIAAAETLSPQNVMRKPARIFRQLHLVRRFLPRTPGKIVDIGGSFGAALYFFRRYLNPKAVVVSIEASKEFAPYYQVAGIEQADRLADIGGGTVDVFLSSHCFEHFYCEDLADVLSSTKTKLKAGGVLMVEVPNANFMKRPELKSEQHGQHFTFFSRASLRQILERSGFDVVFLATSGPHTTLGIFPALIQKVASAVGRVTMFPPAFIEDLLEYGGQRSNLRAIAIKRH